MEHTVEVDVAASASRLWDVLADVERLPELTPSMASVEHLGEGELGVGSRVRIDQPKLAAMTWEITEWDPGRGFTWEMSSAGVRVRASHVVTPTGPASCRLTLTMSQRGFLVPLLELLVGRRGRRYMAQEADGLKRAAETARSA
ncbi:MAG: SRPBCC family protein [Actinomycetota bacterium]|nr:SRPBCC family protein [Actinomycetota bacterium]